MLYVYFSLNLTFMNLLLPHRFKKLGAAIAPAGLLIWLCLQKGIFNEALSHVFVSNTSAYAVIATVFFCFIGGIYFLTFSKEGLMMRWFNG